MTNAQVVDRFLDGIVGQGNSCSSDGEVLKSFNTEVARRITDGDHVEILLSSTYYSQTTSKLLSMVEKASHKKPDTECVRVEDVMSPPSGRCMDCLFVRCICGEVDDLPTEPEDGDFTTEDYVNWYEFGTGKKVVVVEDPHSKSTDLRCDFNADRWQRMVMDYMNKSNFWPNVWYQGERGDWNLLSIKTGKFVTKDDNSHVG